MRSALISLLVLAACGSSSGPRIHCPAGTVPEQTEWARGCKLADGTWHGPFAALYDDGKPRKVGHYQTGVPEGTWTAYAPDGAVLGTYEVVGGTGIERGWHPNGQLAVEIPYRDGRRHGVARWWHDNGQPSSESPMHEGRVHGVVRRWSKEGTQLHEGPQEHGRPHGLARGWNEAGELVRETEYFHGTRIREVTYDGGEVTSTQTWQIAPPGDRIVTREHPRIDAAWQRCTEHHECELVSFRCCACGAADYVAVNFLHEDQARKRLEPRCTAPCPSMLCQRVSGRCEAGRCVSAE